MLSWTALVIFGCYINLVIIVLVVNKNIPGGGTRCIASHVQVSGSFLVLLKFGSEPKFGPEPLGLNSKFSSWFRIFAELNLRSSSRFSQSYRGSNLNWTLVGYLWIFVKYIWVLGPKNFKIWYLVLFSTWNSFWVLKSANQSIYDQLQ